MDYFLREQRLNFDIKIIKKRLFDYNQTKLCLINKFEFF